MSNNRTTPSHVRNTLPTIFRMLQITSPEFLGEGSESLVYAYTDNQVVRIYKETYREYVEQLQTIYEMLAAYGFPFVLPHIDTIQQVDTVIFTLEKRLMGRSLAAVYPQLQVNQKKLALDNFFSAATCFEKVRLEQQPYGQIIASQPLNSTIWPDFMKQTIVDRMAQSASDLYTDGVQVDKVVRTFLDQLATLPARPAKNLVHGDYYFDNVLVNERLEVSAVLDISPWSLCGDYHMDIAGCVFLSEVFSYFSSADADYLQQLAIRRYGDEILRDIALYKMYYSLALSNCKISDPSTYAWSLRNIRNYQEALSLN